MGESSSLKLRKYICIALIYVSQCLRISIYFSEDLVPLCKAHHDKGVITGATVSKQDCTVDNFYGKFNIFSFHF